MDEGGYHEPVLLEEVLELLAPRGAGIFLDGTVGGGGHARALLERCPDCRLLALDRDPDALERAARELAPFGERVLLRPGRFHDAVELFGLLGPVLSGALLDLGVSSAQLDRDTRGFAFRRGVPLDMRMEGASGRGPSGADFLNEADEVELAQIFREYGEEPRWRRLAREVVKRRGTRPFVDSDDLVGALAGALGRAPSNQEKARAFQALRIVVNRELEFLEAALPRIREALAPGGRLAVISYHSLEDRIVKNAFREWSRSCVCPPELPICVCRGVPLGTTLTTKPIRPGADEVRRNPRARSALLRGWRRAA